MATRWVIASAGNISFDFANAIRVLPKENHEIVAVGARSLDRAKEFAEKFEIPSAFGSYEELTKCSNIDCVYIGSIHTQHYAMCKLFMNAGMNVLCEKPMSMTAKQCREVLDLARSKNVFYLEGFWSRFFPVYADLRRELDEECVGDIRILQVTFGDALFDSNNVRERIAKKDLGGGALLDIGCYTLQFAQFIFKGEKPLEIKSTACKNKDGVDETVVTTLTYSGNRVAVLTCSLTCNLDQTATVYGSNGYIKLENFWNPERLIIPGRQKPTKTFGYPLPKAKYPMVHRRSEGLVYEIEEVRQCLLKGLKESPKMTLDESMQISEMSDEIRRQCDIVYAEDSL